MEGKIGVALEQNLWSPTGELLGYCNQKPIEINQFSNASWDVFYFFLDI